MAWIAPNAKQIYIGQPRIQNPAMGFRWGEVVVIVSCVVIPSVAQKTRAKNTPATRRKKTLRNRLGKVQQEPARWGSHRSLAASLVSGPWD